MSDFVAQVILNQLGGAGKIKTMIGAKDFVNLGSGLGFKYPTAKYVEIKLNGKDLYDLTFKSIRGMKVKELAKYTDIYSEDLVKTFEKETSLYLSF